MGPFVNYLADGLLDDQQPPCLSLYQPTHRHHPESQQDPIRFRNLVKAIERSLRLKYPANQAQPLLAPFHALAEDRSFWRHTLDGLAVLGAAAMFRVYRLQRPVRELTIVADSFHLKPLLRIFQSADRYQVLCLNRQEIRLLEGNRDALDEIELARGVPRTITDALGEQSTEPHRTVASYGLGASGGVMHFGYGAKKDAVDSDTEKFFRAVDRAILDHHSRPSGLPLMLAALKEYHAPFRAVTRNPFLMTDGLKINPDALSLEELGAQAWQKVEPLYLERLADLVERYQTARSRQLGSSDLAEVARATVAGRVGTLLVEADRQVTGRIDSATGRIELRDAADPDTDDLLDDLAEKVLRTNGEVVIVPAERMPSATGVAATYRY
jgi:hypothetical protein